MDNLSSKKEMQFIISQYIENHAFDDVKKGLEIYKNTFGPDVFTNDCELRIMTSDFPLVSLICLSCPDDYIDAYLSRQIYPNVEVVRTTRDDTIGDIVDYIFVTESKYICFLEPNHNDASYKILKMVEELEKLQSVNICITPRCYIDSSGVLIGHPPLVRFDIGNGANIVGRDLLVFSINTNENLYGNLSALMVSTEYARNVHWNVPNHSLYAMNLILFLYQLLLTEEEIHIMNTSLTSTIIKPYQNDASLRSAYKEFLASFYPQKVNEISTTINSHIFNEIT